MSRRAFEELLAMRLESHRRRGRTPHKGCAEAVLEVLNARGLAVSMANRQRVLAFPELATLRGWLRRAIVAARTSDVLAK